MERNLYPPPGMITTERPAHFASILIVHECGQVNRWDE